MTAVEAVVRVLNAFDRLNVPYMTVGSFSSNVYGEPRSTKDADFVIQLGDISVSKLAAEIGGGFKLDPQMSFETITATSRYRLRHEQTAFLVELFLLSDDPHDRSRFARRALRDVGGGRQAYVATAEDVIVTKLRWSRQGQRKKDIDDAANVIAVQQGNLDLDYIRRWCDQHGTREVFERLLVDPTAQ